MKRMWKKALTLILCCALAVQLLPMSVLAAGGDPTNKELMSALEDICDSEEDAERYYDLLEQYGFMDGSGNAADSWTITMDGETVTLEEIRALLDSDDCDMSKVVVVDGTPVTLEDLDTMIAIEDYIAYLEETYYSPREWSAEQLANLEDLAAQISTEGLEVVDADGGSWTGSVNHNVRLEMETGIVFNEPEKESLEPYSGSVQVWSTDTILVTVRPTEAQTEDITFTWRIAQGNAQAEREWNIRMDGSVVTADEIMEMLAEDDCDLTRAVTLDGEEMTLGELAEIIDADEWTVTIPAGSTDAAELYIDVSGVQGRVDGTATFLVQIYDVVNALVEDEDENGETVTSTRWEQEIEVRNSEDFLYRVEVKQETDSVQGDYSLTENNWNGSLLGEKYYRTNYSWGNWSLFKPCLNGTDYTNKDGVKAMINGNVSYQYISEENTVLTYDLSNVNMETKDTNATKVGISASVGSVKLTRPDIFGDSRYKSDIVTSQKIGSNSAFFDDSKASDETITRKTYGKSGYELEVSVGDGTEDNTFRSNTYTFPSFWGSESGSASLSVTAGGNSGIARDGKVYVDMTMYNTMYLAYCEKHNDSGVWYYQNYWWCFFYPELQSFDVTLTLWDTNQAANATLSAAEGTYYAGQSIPIVATFDYPMEISKDMYIQVNGQPLYPEEIGTTANTCTFLYQVLDADNTELQLTSGAEGCNLSATGANGLDVTVTLKDEDVDLSGASIVTPDKSAAIAGMQAEIQDPFTDPVMNVTVGIVDDAELDGELTAWLLKDLEHDDETGVWTSQSLTILYNGKEYPLSTTNDYIQGGTLTAEIPVSLNTTDDTITRGAELLIDGKICMGLYATAQQEPAVFLTEDDVTATISVYQTDGVTPYIYTDDTYTIWIQEAPSISTAIELADNEWSFGDTEKTTTLQKDGDGNYTLADEDADFVWWIGDEDGEPDSTVANIDAAGKISAVGSAGTAYIYLTALNGDNKMDDDTDRAVTVKAYQTAVMEDETGETADPVQLDCLRFDVGLTPFLYIPYDEVSSVAGQDVTVYWTSNLCDKNEGKTTFDVVVTSCGEEVYTKAVTGTAEDPASGVTIPGNVLTYNYGSEEKNVYELTVTSEYEGVTYTATAVITLQPSPAVVTLGGQESYYIADDTGSVPVTWDIDSFNYYEGEDQFQLLITRDGDTVYETADPGTTSGNGKYSGSYTLHIADVAASSDDVTSYRAIYTVTIAAKNGSDSTWSYDSYMLYVYDRDALDIWINGESSDGVTLSNVKAISEMTQDEILALNRDINLKAMVSINYGEYAWTELSDQIAWASSNSSVAPVAYQQGTLYENIEHFSYTSYRPTTEFGITGLADGSVTVTATHALTGISDTVTVDVERLDNQLYLFQCYPQAATTLTYTNGDGEEKTILSDEDGAAAVYEESGIASDVYCRCETDGCVYLGTFYNESLKSGEGDWTLLERYPCNNLTLRRAAYAYMYLKNPDGTPYTGSVILRGGVYVNGEYVESGLFDYNGEQSGRATQAGNEDYMLDLGEDGRLEITMDQTQWGLATGAVNAWDEVSYVFEIDMGDGSTEYYPMMVTIDANISEAAYVGNGEAVVTFRQNPSEGEHPFVVGQMAYHGGVMESVLDGTDSVGPSEAFPTAQLYTMAMWWGEDEVSEDASLQLFTSDGTAIAVGEGQYEISQTDYPFSDKHITTYSVRLDDGTIGDLLGAGESTGLYLEYYKDGSALTRREGLTFSLTNMIGMEEVAESNALLDEIRNMGEDVDTDADSVSSMDTTDTYVQAALSFVSDTEYTDGDGDIFSMRLAPTSDPTKFLGFIETNIGGLEMDGDDDDDDSQITYATTLSEDDDWDYWPGQDELMTLAGKKSVNDYFADAIENLEDGQKGDTVDDHDLSYSLGGYMETLIYYDSPSGHWKMQILSGGFHVGGGYEWCWNFNTVVGVVPFTATLKIGAEAQVSMDALTAAYTDADGSSELGNDFLTELRMYLYIYFFAGVGIDYAVVAFKLGVYGQIDLDMSFDWLNRKYLNEDGATPSTNDNTSSKLSGQNFKMDGEVGLELVVKVLFIEYDKVLFSYHFNLFDQSTGQWKNLQDVWESDRNAYNEMIEKLAADNSISVLNVGGMQSISLNLAATREDVSYLNAGSSWGSVRSYSLDKNNGLSSLNQNAYAYADPVVTDDGAVVAFLGVPDSYTGGSGIESSNVTAMFATGSGGTYVNPQEIGGLADDEDSGYGDSELALAGSGSFAVAAWTRQMVDIAKDDGAVLTDEDQRMMMDGADIFVSVYTNGGWTTTRIENGGADLAPVVATNGNRAVVAWRSVATASGTEDITDFDQKDTILYKIYDGTGWSEETYTLYNGTSGNVKGITAEMLSDGTAAVSYALDTDRDTETYTDREIVYAVIGTDGEVTRNVRATNDAFLDENPQLTTVSIGGQELFLLGWYTEHSGVEGLDGSDSSSGDTSADIRLIDFDGSGNATQLMPDSLTAAATAADVSVTSDFAFSKGAGTIDDLSILWTERADTVSEDYVEKDMLRAVKFYSYGEKNEQISFTGAADVAEMPDGTLIDHFDAYTQDGTTLKAVILGTTYGADGTVEKTDVTEGGELVSYEVPSSETSMYTATEPYANTIDVPDFLPDYEMLKLGAKTEVWFNIENKGIDPVTTLTVTVGGTTTTYTGLNLLPGGTLDVYADYQVPADAVRDENFTVTAVYADGTTDTFEGLVYMNLPDVQVTDASVIREEDGERDILVKLNNKADAALGESSGTTVRLGFYSDATYESPIPGLDAIDITDPAELKMIDEGGYSTLVTFDVASYLESYYGEPAEIPETGVEVYVKAEVIDTETGEAQGEPNTYNNCASVTCENLQVRSGEDVTITTTLDIDGDTVNAKVDLQNTSLTETTTGNVIITLLAEDGSVLAQQQSYDGEKGLLTLAGEEKATETFTFENITDPFTVSVVYVDMVLDDGEDVPEGLDTLLFPGLDENITVDSFVWDEDQQAYVYDVTVDTLTQTGLIAIARDAEATITVNGEKTDFYTVATNLDLVPGETNVITVTVTNRNGVETSYILTVYDDTNTVAGSVIWDDAEDQDGVRPEEVTVRLYADDEEIDSATVTAEDDWSYEFTNLPIYSDGEEIVYTVTQDPIDPYTTTYDGYDIVNTYTPEQTSVSVSKYWEDEDDKDGIRPDSVTIQLCADGTDTGETLTLSGDNDWQGTFENLDKYRDGGEEIVYTVEETDVPDGYTSTVLAEGDDFEYTVINEHTPTAEDGTTSGGGSGNTGSSGTGTSGDGSTSGGSTVYPDSSGSTSGTGSTGNSGNTGSTGNSGNTGSTGSSGSSDKLPQTGQLNWPIWVFGGLGVVVLGVGIFLVLNDRKKRKQAGITE